MFVLIQQRYEKKRIPLANGILFRIRMLIMLFLLVVLCCFSEFLVLLVALEQVVSDG